MKYDVLLIAAPCRKEWQNSYPPLGVASLGAIGAGVIMTVLWVYKIGAVKGKYH